MGGGRGPGGHPLSRGQPAEVPLDVDDPGPGDDLVVDVVGADVVAGAEKRAHGALGIGRHHDQAPARGRTAPGGRGGELDAGRPDVAGEHLAERVIAHLADEGGRAAEGGHPGRGVGSRAAGDLRGRVHGLVDPVRLVTVDQGHRALLPSEPGGKVIRCLRQDIHDRMSDRHHIEGSLHGRDGSRRRRGGGADATSGPGGLRYGKGGTLRDPPGPPGPRHLFPPSHRNGGLGRGRSTVVPTAAHRSSRNGTS